MDWLGNEKDDAEPVTTYGLTDGLPRAAREALLRLGQVRTYAAGALLFGQGGAADEIFGIDTGRLKVWRVTEGGSLLVLGYAQSNSLIGIIAGSGNIPHVVSGTALTAVTATVWNAARLRELAAREPVFGARLSTRIAQQTGRLIMRMEEMAAPGVEERVARTLARLAVEIGVDNDRGPIHVNLSQAEMAELALTTVPTVSRLFSRWRRDGITVGSRGSITVLNLEALTAIGRVNH